MCSRPLRLGSSASRCRARFLSLHFDDGCHDAAPFDFFTLRLLVAVTLQATEAGCVFGTAFQGHAVKSNGWEFKKSKHWGWETTGEGDNVRCATSRPLASTAQPSWPRPLPCPACSTLRPLGCCARHSCDASPCTWLHFTSSLSPWVRVLIRVCYRSLPQELIIDIGKVHEHAMLTYLVSGKRELGTAKVVCEGGCMCEPMELQAKTDLPIQVRFQKRIKMLAPSNECKFTAKVTGGYFQARVGRRFSSSLTCRFSLLVFGDSAAPASAAAVHMRGNGVHRSSLTPPALSIPPLWCASLVRLDHRSWGSSSGRRAPGRSTGRSGKPSRTSTGGGRACTSLWRT